MKKILEEFKEASSLEKFSTIASIFTIMGVSLITVFNALGSLNLLQVALTLIYGGIVFIVLAFLILGAYSVLYYFSTAIPSAVMILLIIGVVIVLLGLFCFAVYSGVEVIKTFE